MFNPRFDYPVLESLTLDCGSRTYRTRTGDLPSVTTILSKVGDKSALEAWRKWVGEAVAARETLEATNLGSLVHKHIECHLRGEDRPGGGNLIHKMARSMANTVIEGGLPKVSDVWGIESNLYFPRLYAGTSDLIGVYDGVPSICDFKTAKKMKNEAIIEGYFMQGAAYAVAHDELFGTKIRQIVIFMVTRECQFQPFVIRPAQFRRYLDSWMRCVETYYQS